MASGGSCPVGMGSKKAADSALNDANKMEPANQQSAEGQAYALPKERETSSIPNAEGQAWVYPSEQMFYNAMRRKGWTPREEDMAAVVAIHNAVNERAWAQVLAWERLHERECPNPRLARFQGKPTEPSPRARVRQLLGFKPPFDRHDWVVDRCGQEVTYLIDFYNGSAPAPGGPPAMFIDARPNITSVSTLVDRTMMPFYRWAGIVKGV
mmetsp:Transcript_22734/g.76349  ORF Transcript_22734/g.76349 Transcript_22734/m.76349 type:complete len:210 (+) Transcript_22734:538-1167(+)